ncbi:MBL fold metallo-hydrolase [Nocardia shimofusensis]|uniref:MBL fold metallo-hydrolase n=1 Tax=Nocardia shimofusensis TaxID=228596 RepID=UPI0008309D85|nr:MBL fold metallo-hydrolase [Nocardia shimofusensis]
MTITRDRLNHEAVDLRSLDIGDHRVTYLPDGVARIDPYHWLPDADEQIWQQFADHVDDDGYLAASVGALLIEYGNRAMLIDAGFGPLAVPTQVGLLRGGKLIDSLAAAGRSIADLDLVALTHLHMDHLGWLWQSHPDTTTNLFAGIPILVSHNEWQNLDLAIADGAPPEVLEVIAAQVRTIGEHEIFPGVHAIPTPGHSLGHTSYRLTSGGEQLLVFGDALTSPIQITHPNLTSSADDDPARSRASARWLINQLTHPDTVGFGVHFADIQFGRVTTIGGIHHWQPVPTAIL